MSPGPEQSVMLSLLGGGFVAAFLHAALPTHWLPLPEYTNAILPW